MPKNKEDFKERHAWLEFLLKKRSLSPALKRGLLVVSLSGAAVVILLVLSTRLMIGPKRDDPVQGAFPSDNHVDGNLPNDPYPSLGTEPMGTEPMGTEPMGTEPMGTEPMGTEPRGNEPELVHRSWIESQEDEDSLLQSKTKIAIGERLNFRSDLILYSFQHLAEAIFTGRASPELLDVLRKSSSRKLRLFVRVVIVGRGLKRLSTTSEYWTGSSWREYTNNPIPMDINLEAFREGRQDVRLGGIKVPVVAYDNGCAGVTLSIWNDEFRLPLDDIVLPVSVGNVNCDASNSLLDMFSGRRSGTSETVALADARPALDAAIHIFDFSIDRTDGPEHSVAVLVPRRGAQQVQSCPHFAWQTPRPIGEIFGSRNFARDLSEARKERDYAPIGNYLYASLIPRSFDGRCGGQAAAAYLERLALTNHSLFVRLVNVNDENIFFPLGLLFFAEDSQGRKRFERIPQIRQPLFRESYVAGHCVGSYSFFIPEELEISDDRTLPVNLSQELLGDLARISAPLRNLDSFEKFMDDTSAADAKSRLLFLLGHHSEGDIFFESSRRRWSYSSLQRYFSPGSVAILDTCSGANPAAGDFRLVRSLNNKNIDVMILSPFDVPVEFGVPFARNLVSLIAEAATSNKTPTIAQILSSAKDTTIKELQDTMAAEGLANEFLLVGNGDLRLCGKNGGG